METPPGIVDSSATEVPRFDTRELFPRRNRYCVCIFVINEGQKIIAQLERMLPIADECDLVIADGGSTDGSLEPAVLQRCQVRTLLTKTGEGRLGAQMRMAFFYALEQGYDGVIVIDGNNKDDPSAIPRFARALDEGYDHVQGSRFIAGGRAVNTPLSRLLGLKLLHAPLVSMASGFRYTDTTNGFRAYSRRLLEDSRVAPFRSVFAGYELHYYLAIRAARLGFRVTEVPVTREYPAHGKTPTKISPLRGNLTILKALFKSCLHRFNPADG
ncbi:MAG: glycosyltransferase family 2 protein [Gammaproteobacteria bacterium]|nr:glycosyltransferase family 2 protein [Gammaproteobacteria bacterium]